MRNLKLGFFLTAIVVLGGGCREQPRGVETGHTQVVHDERWHYDHETSAQWRCDHPWEDGSYVSKLNPDELKKLVVFAQSGKPILSSK